MNTLDDIVTCIGNHRSFKRLYLAPRRVRLVLAEAVRDNVVSGNGIPEPILCNKSSLIQPECLYNNRLLSKFCHNHSPIIHPAFLTAQAAPAARAECPLCQSYHSWCRLHQSSSTSPVRSTQSLAKISTMQAATGANTQKIAQ